MARPLRMQLPGGVYHVMSHGNAGEDVYRDDADRRLFLATLRSVTERHNILCHTYCLMDNHYHLLLETPDGNLSVGIRHLNGVYAQSFNRRHHRTGHLFRARFKSKLVEKETYLLVLSRYIALNPVRAGSVREPLEWAWSSYRALAGLEPTPPFLTTDWLLASFHENDRRRAQIKYRRFVRTGQDDSGSELEDRPILGSEEFVARHREILRGAASIKDVPRIQRFAARPGLQAIFADLGGKDDRNKRIRAAHVHHGYTMTEIARHLGLHLMTISRVVRSKC